MRARYALFTFLLLLLPAPATAAPGDAIWLQTYGGSQMDYAQAADAFADGGFVFAGSTASFGAGGNDLYLVRTDADGDTLWTLAVGGTGNDDAAEVVALSDGGVAAIGTTNSFGAQGWDYFVVRTDADGHLLWSRTYGGSDSELGASLQETDDGGLILAGTSATYGAGEDDIYVVRTDANGDTLWTRAYGTEWRQEAACIRKCSDGAYIVVGITQYYDAADDFYAFKIDDSGTLLWTQTYGRPGQWVEQPTALVETTDGEFVIAGLDVGYAGVDPTNILLVRIDTNGNEIWSQIYFQSGYEEAWDLEATPGGGVIVGGSSGPLEGAEPMPLLLGIDNAGAILWSQSYPMGERGWGYGTALSPEGSVVLAGSVYGIGAGHFDFFALKAETAFMNLPPQISDLTRTPVQPEPGEPCEVAATITDDGAVDHAELHYDAGAGYLMLPMAGVDDRYSALIPGQVEGTTVRYYVVAYDDLELSATSDTLEYVAAYLTCCDVDMVPDQVPVEVPPGGSFGLTGFLGNLGDEPIQTDVVINVVMPGEFHYQIAAYNNVPLAPGEYLTPHMNQQVPLGAAPGLYRYEAFCGNLERWEVCDSTSFTFTVTGDSVASSPPTWTLGPMLESWF